MTIAKFRTTRRTALNGDTTPVIDINTSWVIRRFSSSPLVMRINYLMSMCVLFISEGCRVVIICDGEKIVHTKRSTTKRTADLHRELLHYHSSKCKLSCNFRRLNSMSEAN